MCPGHRAVGCVLGVYHRNVGRLLGPDITPRTVWVVRVDTGLPGDDGTRDRPEITAMFPQLLNSEIITTGDELRALTHAQQRTARD